MTDQTAQAPTENVARGAALALLSIPAAIIAFTVVGALFGGVSGIAAIIVPTIAAFLYRVGAGAPLSRAGWVPFVVVSAIAVLVGTFAGIASSAWSAFNAVGGDNALTNPAFWRAVGNQFTVDLGDNLVPILIGLVLGAVGIAGVIRGRLGGQSSGRVAPQNVAAYTGDTAVPNPYVAGPAAPVVPPAPPAAPSTNTPSPGIILNGKPLDPDKK